jgi:hypothetical protein
VEKRKKLNFMGKEGDGEMLLGASCRTTITDHWTGE